MWGRYGYAYAQSSQTIISTSINEYNAIPYVPTLTNLTDGSTIEFWLGKSISKLWGPWILCAICVEADKSLIEMGKYG